MKSESNDPSVLIMKVRLTKEDAIECDHKMGILCDTPDLQEDYRIKQSEADEIYRSIPKQGGEWEFPEWAAKVVREEMKDHANIMRGIADDARGEGKIGQALRIDKQAKKFETIFA